MHHLSIGSFGLILVTHKGGGTAICEGVSIFALLLFQFFLISLPDADRSRSINIIPSFQIDLPGSSNKRAVTQDRKYLKSGR